MFLFVTRIGDDLIMDKNKNNIKCKDLKWNDFDRMMGVNMTYRVTVDPDMNVTKIGVISLLRPFKRLSDKDKIRNLLNYLWDLHHKGGTISEIDLAQFKSIALDYNSYFGRDDT